MKKILYIIIAALTLTSCGNFDKMNTDPNRLDNANPGSFIDPILYNMAVYNWGRANGYTASLMQNTISTNSLGGVERYFISDAAGDGAWNTYYKWYSNIDAMEKNAVSLNNDNYRAVALVLKSWVLQLIADSYGDAPMTDAGKGSEGIFQPSFNTQREIYAGIIANLEAANEMFNISAGLVYNKDGELLFKSDVAKWKKFCNSLLLRVLLRASSDASFGANAKMATILGDATKYPVFTSNDESALLAISGIFPQEPPMNRPQDFTSYRGMSTFFVDQLKEWNDPRLPIYATKVDDPNNPGQKGYFGWESGYAIAPSFTPSNIVQALAIAPMKLAIMPYSEVEFIRAELIQRGVASGNAQTAYENGVRAAVEQWGGTLPDNYFANPSAAYNGTLERILAQKYYALFFVDYQQWFEYTRTGQPRLPRGAGVPDGNYLPYRFKYPATIQRTNMENYKKAVQNMGGDDFNTKLFWQTNLPR